MSFAPPRRPRRGDTEEDLLREQREFNRARGNKQEQEDVPPAAETPEAVAVKVVGEVVERSPVVCKPPAPTPDTADARNAAPFPEVFRVKPSSQTADGKKKKLCLFAQMKNAKRSAALASPQVSEASASSFVDFGPRSAVLDGSGLPERPGEAEAIHRENADRIRAMSEKEIQESRDEIMKAMDPKILEFLRAKKKGAEASAVQDPKETESSTMETEASPASAESKPRPGAKKSSPKSQQQDERSDEAKRPKLQGLHMDRSEPEKMEWTRDVPPPPPPSQQTGERSSGYSARFDFEGRLLPPSAEAPSGSGLYHHGEEPERPGYTAEELLTLARSTNPQQRSLAFATLAAVIRTGKSGALDTCLEQNIVAVLLESDLVILLRASLDETVSTVRESALLCLRQLLDSQFDEASMDAAQCTELGHLQPSLPTAVVSDQEKRREFRKDEPGLKDAEVIKLDVIKGLLRTDVLQRFAFLLQQPTLTSSAVSNILCILTRISRHSLRSASLVLVHEALPQAIVQAADKHRGDAKVVGPFLKLARVLAAWNPSLAEACDAKFGLRERISRLVAAGFGSLGPSLEALRVWDCLLRHGLLADLFLDLFPLLAKFLVSLRAQLDPAAAPADPESAVHMELACAVAKVVQAASSLVGVTKEEGGEALIEFRHLSDLQRLLTDCLNALAYRDYDLREQDSRDKLRLLTVLLETCAELVEASRAGDGAEVAALREVFLSLTESRLVRSACSSLEKGSSLLSGLTDGRSARDPENLPGLGAMCRGGVPVPTGLAGSTSSSSPFRLASSAMKLGSALGKDVRAAASKWLARECGSYLAAVCREREKLSLRSSWFAADEVTFLARAAAALEEGTKSEIGAERIARTALGLLQTSHAFLVGDVFHQVLEEVTSQTSLEMGLEQLNVDTAAAARSSFADSARQLYSSVLPLSRGKTRTVPTKSLTISNSGEQLLPTDWIFLPLLELYNRCSEEEGKTTTPYTSEDVGRMETCLRWIASDLSTRSDGGASPAEAAVYFARLSVVFLVDGGLFMEAGVAKWLKKCFLELLRIGSGHFDLDSPVPGIGAFKPFYVQFLDEYFASSYGDPLFASAALLPTLSSSSSPPSSFRSLAPALWCDRADDLLAIRLAAPDLPPPLSPARFVSADCGEALAGAFARAVASGRVDPERTPLLFEIAAGNLEALSPEMDSDSHKAVEKYRKVLEEKGVRLR